LEHGSADGSPLVPPTDPDDVVEITRTIAFALAIADNKLKEKQSGEDASLAGRNTAARARMGSATDPENRSGSEFSS
jgi:hypothetical protein